MARWSGKVFKGCQILWQKCPSINGEHCTQKPLFERSSKHVDSCKISGGGTEEEIDDYPGHIITHTFRVNCQKLMIDSVVAILHLLQNKI